MRRRRCAAYLLQYAPRALREDRDFVLAAVGQNGNAFQHASAELRRNLRGMHRVIKRARLSAYLTVVGTRHIATRLLVSNQPQLGQQVLVEGHTSSP